MEKAKVEIEIQRTDKGNIRIKFKDGGNYLVQDIPANIGLISALEIELKYALMTDNEVKEQNQISKP